MTLKLSLFYDIACPRSWVFYQVLQKKISLWQSHRDLTVEYIPVSRVYLYRKIHGIHPSGIIANKKDYMLRELYDTCDFYNIHKSNFEMTYSVIERRSRSTLLLLNVLRRKWPAELYQTFLERMWSGFWEKLEIFTHTSNFFRIGRELRIPFAEMENVIIQIENRDNYIDGSKIMAELIMDERITDIPWFRVNSVFGNEKLIGFTDIIRLELMDKLIAQPFFNPLNHNVGNPLFNLSTNDNYDNDNKEDFEDIDERKRYKRWKNYREICTLNVSD